jgi:hypothetical protein
MSGDPPTLMFTSFSTSLYALDSRQVSDFAGVDFVITKSNGGKSEGKRAGCAAISKAHTPDLIKPPRELRRHDDPLPRFCCPGVTSNPSLGRVRSAQRPSATSEAEEREIESAAERGDCSGGTVFNSIRVEGQSQTVLMELNCIHCRKLASASSAMTSCYRTDWPSQDWQINLLNSQELLQHVVINRHQNAQHMARRSSRHAITAFFTLTTSAASSIASRRRRYARE